MLAPDEVASRIPQWVRTLLVGLAVVLATGAGPFAYRWYSQPRTMTVRLMSAIAGRLTRSGVRAPSSKCTSDSHFCRRGGAARSLRFGDTMSFDSTTIDANSSGCLAARSGACATSSQW
jgi:hypothetical protein